ncbi:MbnP family protein [Pelagicoccus sp. SDUM812005]|uniref:MbnP family protein n=1 Tax=Pelagicoccus sp. SDUM812005 TaxID=3041257 RepID=UPI00281066FF|nr:MbnP family protein [Pelagicoccus sp. SDUM812005]MDQ8181986.1 cytochrome c peroxidase [Pelagicoccus sp. SDUM812005]
MIEQLQRTVGARAAPHCRIPLPNFSLFTLLLSLLALPPSLLATPLSLTHHHSFNQAPIRDAHWHRNASGTLLTFSRLSYYLSDLAFVDAAGNATPASPSLHYVDAFTPDPAPTTLDLPPGDYTAIRFNLGLPPDLNHSDPKQYPASHPLSSIANAMHWSWQSGYIFCAIEGYATATDATEQLGFSYHLANDAFLVPVEIPLDLAHRDSPQSLELAFDLGALLDGQGFSLLERSSTHSRPGDPVAISLAAQLPKAFSATRSSHATASATSSAPAAPPAAAFVGTPLPFSLPKNFPIPNLPTDYPLTQERVELGQTLFHSTDLSRNGALSCVSCHSAENAFADPRQFSVGFDGSLGRRQSMPLLNLAWKTSFFWDGRAASLREQVLHPIQDPTEMGAELPHLLARLQANPVFAAQFQAAFGDPQITAERLGIALESFLLTLTSYQSKFDSAVAGQTELTAQEKRGFELFTTEYDPRRQLYEADCFHCHGSATFSDNLFHNNGLPPTDDRGRAAFTGRESDAYSFATPTLRNVAATAPYMHDGRFQSLEEVIAHYNSGIQKSSTLDPNLAKHPTTGLQLSDADQAALVAFLRTLTDPRFE